MLKLTNQAVTRRSLSIVMFHRSNRMKPRQKKKPPFAISITKTPTETSDRSTNIYYFEFVLFLIITLLVITFVHPQSIAHFPFSNAFLAFHLPIFLTTSSFFLIVIRHKFFAYLLSLSLQTIILFKLNSVVIDSLVWIIWLICALLFSGLSIYTRHKQYKYRL